METYFEMVMCSEIEKRMIATFFLKDDVMDWWKSTRQTVDVSTLTWEGFVEFFREKYFPSTVKEEFELEFLALVQGEVHTGTWARVQDHHISTLCLTTKELMYESALNFKPVNKTRGDDVESKDARGKGKAITSGGGSAGPKDGSWKRLRTYHQTPAKVATPPVRATPVRLWSSVRCFTCGEMGHYASAYPKPRK
ncbi:uncharacterized protein LOC126783839 [Argentina anserina]|uniref:uncharacterized protein LOC126783839 n=1 Tax=Argentina anserina TaxID=57926 RepID=UPI00217669BF|nr:uncharacterized protein LOC126783839 [Potentilla anserina]